jgi:hypothetical protein
MRPGGRVAVWGLALCLALSGLGCDRDEAGAPGVAATVNGAPIAVAALEARHDLTRLVLPMADNPAVTELRSEYGAVLADMIVARLAGQELARHHQSVTDAELAAAETAIRADYPGETFAAMLVEERIDLARWREALRDRLTLEKFAREILRPTVRVGVTEAADYYKEHLADFAPPARTRFLLVQAKEVPAAKAALAAYRKSPSRTSLEGQAGVTVREVTVTDRNLAKSWREALRILKVGDASPVLTEGSGGTVLVLIDHQGETVLEPAKAYAQVEALLSARKLEAAMAAWLADNLPKARIRVNALLLAKADQAASAQASAPTETPSAASTPSASAPQAPSPASTASASGPQASAPSAASVPPASPPSATPGSPSATGPSALTTAPEEANAPETGPSASGSPSASPPSLSQTPAPAAKAPSESEAPGLVPPAPPRTSSATTAPPVGGAGQEAASAASAPAISPASPTAAPAPDSPPGPAPAEPAREPEVAATSETAPGSVEFTAVKASWILFTADDGQEERTYLKPGNPLRLTFSHRLRVRLGSPSEVSYRYGTREETVAVGKKESRVLEFP